MYCVILNSIKTRASVEHNHRRGSQMANLEMIPVEEFLKAWSLMPDSLRMSVLGRAIVDDMVQKCSARYLTLMQRRTHDATARAELNLSLVKKVAAFYSDTEYASRYYSDLNLLTAGGE